VPYDPTLYDDLLPDPDYESPPFSTWPEAQHGPEPRPDWVLTDRNALDTELGVLKSGKDADVHLIHRGLPGGAGCLLAAKRYRDTEHRMFHRDAGYQEGRRTRKSRDARAIEKRTSYGRARVAGKWAQAEFEGLSLLWQAGAPVPYPVQVLGTELLLEFIGQPDGTAAPRLAQCRPDAAALRDLYEQCVAAMRVFAAAGYAHGDLSAYNLLVHDDPLASRDGRLVVIDVPQIVDLVANPQGISYLERDCVNVCAWFTSRGLAGAEPQLLLGDLMAEAVAGW
jgi:RIO kinase 1